MIYAIVFTAKNKESGEWASRVSGTKDNLGAAKAFFHSECARLIGNDAIAFSSFRVYSIS